MLVKPIFHLTSNRNSATLRIEYWSGARFPSSPILLIWESRLDHWRMWLPILFVRLMRHYTIDPDFDWINGIMAHQSEEPRGVVLDQDRFIAMLDAVSNISDQNQPGDGRLGIYNQVCWSIPFEWRGYVVGITNFGRKKGEVSSDSTSSYCRLRWRSL